MSVQIITIGKRQYVLLPKRDFDQLVALAEQAENDYWSEVALAAEAEAKAKGEKPIPFEEVERELDEQNAKRRRRPGRRRKR